jgi:hypothetical protein
VARYFLDSEFIEDGKTIDLISLALVCEDGREYYAQFAECNFAKASIWVRGHVFPVLQDCPERSERHYCARNHENCVWKTRATIREDILRFVGYNGQVGEKPQFWGYFADYDWVAFAQLFGQMIDLPKGWPMYCMDLKQLCVSKGDPRLPKQVNGEHHALMDARWNKEVWSILEPLPHSTRTTG